jgi:SNF2 family DNA or RNA helicase
MNNKIEDRILQMFNERSFDKDFLNLNLDDNIQKLLLNYQTLHVYNLVSSLKKNRVIVDGSNTGTGKSYTAIATCAQLKLTPIIICPKTIISMWHRVCQLFNVKPLCITNYESIRNGHIIENDKRIKPTFLKINEDGKFKWNLTNNHIVIFDEAHKCKNKKSLNGQLLLSLKNIANIMLLSATLADTPENFHVFGYMLDFYKDLRRAKNWINGIVREDISNKNKISCLYKRIFPSKGSVMTLDDISQKMLENQISSECYDIDKEHKQMLNNAYKHIEKEYKTNQTAESLVKIIKARKIIELVKVPIFCELTEKYLALNKSVVIFVNFTETLNKLTEYFNKENIEYGTINGSQTIEERTNIINNFQKDQLRIIICMMQAGGVGISLNDKNGKYARVSLISPSFSSIELVQALGRIYRAGTLTPVIQKIIYCADTHEENISKNVNSKIKFLNKLSDNDLFNF